MTRVMSVLALILATMSFAYSEIQLEQIELPDGFEIGLVTDEVPEARSMALSDDGILYVGSKAGEIYAVTDSDGDWQADEVAIVASDLDLPVGVSYYDGDLYISEVSRITKVEDIDSKYDSSPALEVVTDDLPSERWHGWKFIKVGPDGKLYVPVGAPCNVCLRDDERYASIMRMNPDGSDIEVIAHGIRNTVGFDWHPDTGDLWFTDNGRDWMGDNSPPDELNVLTKVGQHFGFPYFHGSDTEDTEYYDLKPDGLEITTPAQDLGPHVAALGMRFYTGNQFPEIYRNRIFIAEHGSWNRSTPIGYRVTMVEINGLEGVSYEVFAEGWMDDEKSGDEWGRPVDVLVADDGSLLVSDDKAGAIYRISYE